MENNTFKYTYSAKEQAEIQKIRGKYVSPEENGIDRLRRLDAGVAQKASASSKKSAKESRPKFCVCRTNC